MATAIQRRRGSTAQHANFTGLSGEITIDTDLNTIIVHDGSTEGGERLAKFSELTEFSGNAITSITTDGNSGLLGGVTEGAANLSINYESLTGNLVPSANNTFSLGSPTNVWKDLYVGAQTIFIDGISLSVVDGGLQFGGNAVAVADDPSVTTDGITEGNTNLYYTDARANAAMDAYLSGGTGVTYTSGTISIGQDVGTTDDVSFNDVTVSGNLIVSGTTTTVNTEELRIADNIITLNSDFTGGSPTEDAGIEVERGDLFDVSVFWDESQDRWKFTNDGNINYNLPTSTTDVAEGDNLYFTNARVNAFIQSSITTTDIDEDTNLYYTDTRARESVSVTDAGGDGSLSYSNVTGVFTYTGPSAAEARAHFSAGTGITLTDGEIATASIPNSSLANSDITINGATIALGSSSSIDTDDISEGLANLYYTDTRARASVSATDAGGDGSFSYDSGTGVFTYTGPSASEVRAHFSGGTGVTITDGAIAIGQDVSTGANVDFNQVSGLASPTAADHAANKEYVDEVAQGLRARTAAKVLTDSNLAATYNNGTDGVGATLTATTNVEFPTVDGITGLNVVGTRVLVIGQTSALENGLYVLDQIGITGTQPWILRRCVECDTSDEIPGSFVFVKEGDTYAATGWVAIVELPFTIGTDDINWTQFSGAGTFTAGAGLDLTGTTFSVNVSDGIAISGDNVILANTVAGTGITYSSGVLNIGQAVGTGDNVTFNNVTAAGVFAGNGSALTTLNASNISSGTLASSRLPELVVGDFADAAIQTGAEAFADSDTVLMTAAAVDDLILSKGYSTTTGTVTSVGSGNGLTGGPITGSGSLAVGAGAFIIVNAANVAVDATSANTAGKVVARDGSGNFSAGVITATATQARYADVAERYEADSVIEPGTVVCFGGDKEITVCAHDAHHAVAGVISTDPAYLMNEAAGNNDTHPPVALTGRVPCKVTGVVDKGDLMVSSAVAGHAQADNAAAPGRILGKAIGSSEGGEAVIEVLVTLM